MKIELINQPISGINKSLGNNIKNLLSRSGEDKFETFEALVAFAKSSGVSRITNAINSFREAGGTIKVIIGTDLKATSVQALELLLACTDELFIYHDSMPSRTFHPKAYLFRKHDSYATAIVGSGNLSAGGLFINYETMTKVDLDLTDANDLEFNNELEAMIDFYSDINSGCAIKLDAEILKKIIDDYPSLLTDESNETSEEPSEGSMSISEYPDESDKEPLFGSMKFAPPPAPDIKLPTTPPAHATPVGVVGAIAKDGFWKLLSNFDVSTSSGPGQIIVPISCQGYFPSLVLVQGPDAGGKGRQWECYLRVVFQGPTGAITADYARFIIYEPKTGHLRPNTEARFTFHNREIFDLLEQGDILIFERNDNNIWFNIKLIKESDALYGQLKSGDKQRWGEL